MATNVSVFAVDGPVDIYLQDGTVITVLEQETKSVQLIEGGICTISDTPPDVDATGEEEGEHPPPGYVLADKMIKFWQGMKQRWQEAVHGTEINPL